MKAYKLHSFYGNFDFQFHSIQKNPETVSRPPEYDSDDAFEQLADITIGAEDSDTNVEIRQPIEKTCEKKERMRTKKDEQTETGKIVIIRI